MIQTILLVCSIVLAWYRAALPLVSLLPTQWQWVPAAVAAAVALVLDQLPNATGPEGIGVVLISAVVPIVLAATRGYHPTEHKP